MPVAKKQTLVAEADVQRRGCAVLRISDRRQSRGGPTAGGGVRRAGGWGGAIWMGRTERRCSRTGTGTATEDRDGEAEAEAEGERRRRRPPIPSPSSYRCGFSHKGYPFYCPWAEPHSEHSVQPIVTLILHGPTQPCPYSFL
uniref:Uncharacterized protein n=1 Tax=Oryza rufipogon TaxID=4529 RepID=A0A0E0R876_ORYRU